MVLYQKDEILQNDPAQTSCYMKKFPVKGRNLLSQYKVSCNNKKFSVTRRNFSVYIPPYGVSFIFIFIFI